MTCQHGPEPGPESQSSDQEWLKEAKEGEAKITPATLSGLPWEAEGPFWDIRARMSWSGSHGVKVLTAGAGCEAYLRGILPTFYGPGWEATLTAGEGRPTLTFHVTSHRSVAVYSISLELTAQGVLPGGTVGSIGSAVVALHSEYTPPRRIWQGEDAFVNYCIDKLKEVTSIDHRLGCYEPPLLFVKYKVRWS